MEMGKHIARWLATLVAATVLAACGGGGDGSDANASDPPTAPQPDPIATPTPGPAVRLEISPPGGMIDSTTERRVLTLRAYDARGLQVALPEGAAFTNSNRGFELTGTANGTSELRATFIGGATQVSAAVGNTAVAAPPVMFYSAQPAAGALTVSDAQVVGAPQALDANASRGLGFQYRTTLSGVGLPAPGSLMVGTGAQPIAGKVVAAQANAAAPANTDVVLELVPLHELFADLNVSAAYSEDEMARMLVAAPARRAINSVDRWRPSSVPGAACKGDSPALGVLTGELEATVSPHLAFEMLYKISGHAPQGKFVLGDLGSGGMAGGVSGHA
jgi:hypothetical protein